MKAVTGAVLLTGAVMTVSACGIRFNGSTRHHEDRAYDLTGVSAIDVKADSGRVEIVAADTSKVTVTERMSFTKNRRPTTEHGTRDGRLQLRYKCAGGINIGIGGCDVAYRVTVPRGTDVVARTDNGPIRITGVAGQVVSRSDSGSIELADLRTDRLIAQSDSGRLLVGGRADVASLHTDSGSIIADALRVSYSLTAHSDSGRIRATCTQVPPSRVTARTDSGDIDLTLPGGRAYAVNSNTDSGAEKIGVAQDASSPLRVDVSSDSGSITVAKSA